ncbi:MAG: NAD-dependent protein deacetylase [Nocardioidaceae bacterium]
MSISPVAGRTSPAASRVAGAAPVPGAAVSDTTPVPDDRTVPEAAEALAGFLRQHRRLFVLTGAGCSTDSGIPDYRDADGSWKRGRPIQFRAFMRDADARARYWARSMVGWRSFGAASSSSSHHALARLEASGQIGLLVTQNVDGLHQGAGSRNVIDLHGRLDRVVCMTCRHRLARDDWQRQLGVSNPSWAVLDAAVAPDGDADLDGQDFGGFVVPGCPHCQGVVKPDVVFFGENVPPWRHTQATAALATSDAMLVVGSSLMVHSGFRYAVAASRLGRPVACLNLGRTRADHLLSLKIDAPAGPTLASAVGALPA